jgi:hypothetical protein
VLHQVLHAIARRKSAFRALPVMNTLQWRTIPEWASPLVPGEGFEPPTFGLQNLDHSGFQCFLTVARRF